MNYAYAKQHGNRLAEADQIAAILAAPLLWELAEELEPQRDSRIGGRKPTHPVWVFLLWEMLIGIEGGSRAVDRALQADEGSLWKKIRRAARAAADNDLLDEQLVPCPAAPRRHHFNHALRTHLEPARGSIELAVMAHAATVAKSVVLADPRAARASHHHPALATTLVGDGKVIAARSSFNPSSFDPSTGEKRKGKSIDHNTWVDTTTGEVHKRRHEADAKTTVSGDGKHQHGLKFVLSAVRGPQARQMVLMAGDPLRDSKEAELAATQAVTIAELVNGKLLHWAYDKAARGVHISRVIREAGLLPLVRTMRQNGKAKDTDFQVTHPLERPDQTIELHLQQGRPCIRTADVNGDITLTPLTRRRILHRQNTDGTHRFYAEYDLPQEHGGGTVRIPAYETPEDREKKFNRMEHYRPIGEEEKCFRDSQISARQSIESGNRVLDRYLPEGRAHHWGFARNHLQVLTWMFAWNAAVAAVFT